MNMKKIDNEIDKKRRLLLVGCAAGGLGAMAIAVAQPKERVIKVTAKRFDFSPSVIPLKKGVPVVLELTSLDIPMGFNAPDFGVRTDVLPGKVSKLRFIPDKTGEFTFYCDIFCGSGHESMSGSLVVT
ncbi:heme/copper-type cytochrome/quinol oxidase, subunit 2 [Herbaspirillum sp. CF444]|uniref:cupredoxin domain-containing protein n=1 Tax=Herbaspirillum sp. CF444 TaxID=1144319 RepID=UPI0002724B7A|nr:cupredoxin domain-containing protein [Herbaspirillum sp. CF444]EJL92656.1 heme/copper-type cytochrome/quinol oxidase, subunit 2 [Herbaspirillum sp. CF444]